MRFISVCISLLLGAACSNQKKLQQTIDRVSPLVVTEKVVFDTDDPAIWINAADTASSIIIGTDKETGGGLYAFNLQGKIVRKVLGLLRPNNVDIAYGLMLDGIKTDVAIVTERESYKLRFYALPGLQEITDGGLPVFEGEKDRLPMGIAVYKNAADGASYAIVGRKTGPLDGYLWQYRLLDDKGKIAMQLVRKFGRYSGKKEIESIAVDDELGYVYYSDEQTGIRKYYADPSKGNDELALFGKGDFKEDNEGISIYKSGKGTGYILVSDQSANNFNIYPREGTNGNPDVHRRIAVVPVSTNQSDGSDIISCALPGFPGGLFVAMSTDKTFHFYSWQSIAEKAKLPVKID